MRTLYLRNVPADVVERLERLAERDGTSLSTFAVRALGEVARQADNAALLGALPNIDIATDDIVGAIDDGRARR